MKRIAKFGSGSMMLAAALVALPATAGAQATGAEVRAEAKQLLVAEGFTGDSVGDSNFHSLGSCLTANTVVGGENEFDSCADQNTGPVPASGGKHGYLQFTDAGTYHAGGIVYNDALPSDNGIEVTFAQYQYGGTGADGISFFLVDGDTDLTETGAIGGSLGYAQIQNDVVDTSQPGVDGGYLGLGLDAWGNFSADTEGRGSGCPEDQRAPSTCGSRPTAPRTMWRCAAPATGSRATACSTPPPPTSRSASTPTGSSTARTSPSR